MIYVKGNDAKAFAREQGNAKLSLEGKDYDLPILVGSQGERALDMRKLRQQTGLISYDPGYANTGACESNITFIDGESGVLWHRGYSIEELAEHCSFLDVAYLLVHGFLPSREERANFSMGYLFIILTTLRQVFSQVERPSRSRHSQIGSMWELQIT